MTNAGGFVTHSATFEPYGGILEDSGTGSSLGFTGEMHDSTGLVYLRARYTDPVTGTFLTRDPVIGVSGMSQTWNPYSYARNNPINLIDPSGRFGLNDALGIVGATVLGSALLTVGIMASLAAAPILAGVAIGAGAALLIDMFAQLLEGKCQLDGERLAKAMLVGGIAGGVAGLATAGLGSLAFFTDQLALSSMSWAARLGLGAFQSMVGGQSARFTSNLLEGHAWNTNGVGDVATMGFDGAIGAATTGLMELGRWAIGRFAQAGGAAVADDAMVGSRGCNSFSADTLVLTEDGLKPILEIEPGDEVMGYVEATGETGSFPVTDTIHHTDPTIVLLTIDDETLETTAEHPFYTDDGVWVNAADLEVGEQVYSFSGDYGTVESVQVVTISQEMYNLTVAEAHTFFVGEGSWLVHNQQPSPGIALGYEFHPVTRQPILGPFAEATNSVYFRQFAEKGLYSSLYQGSGTGMFTSEFHYVANNAISAGQRLKFNLEYVDIERVVSFDARQALQVDAFYKMDIRVTEWELKQILHNPRYYEATDFYYGSQQIPAEELREWGLEFQGSCR